MFNVMQDLRQTRNTKRSVKYLEVPRVRFSVPPRPLLQLTGCHIKMFDVVCLPSLCPKLQIFKYLQTCSQQEGRNSLKQNVALHFKEDITSDKHGKSLL